MNFNYVNTLQLTYPSQLVRTATTTTSFSLFQLLTPHMAIMAINGTVHMATVNTRYAVLMGLGWGWVYPIPVLAGGRVLHPVLRRGAHGTSGSIMGWRYYGTDMGYPLKCGQTHTYETASSTSFGCWQRKKIAVATAV